MSSQRISDYLRGDVKVMTAILDDLEHEVRRLRSRLGDLQASIEDVMTLEEAQ